MYACQGGPLRGPAHRTSLTIRDEGGRDGRVVDGGGLENGRIGYDVAVIFCRDATRLELQYLATILAF